MQSELNEIEEAPRDFGGRGSLPVRSEGLGDRGDHVGICNCLCQVQS